MLRLEKQTYSYFQGRAKDIRKEPRKTVKEPCVKMLIYRNNQKFVIELSSALQDCGLATHLLCILVYNIQEFKYVPKFAQREQ